MSGSMRLLGLLFAIVVGAFVAVRLVSYIFFTLIVPLAVLIGVAGALYVVVNRKALGTGRHSLP